MKMHISREKLKQRILEEQDGEIEAGIDMIRKTIVKINTADYFIPALMLIALTMFAAIVVAAVMRG